MGSSEVKILVVRMYICNCICMSTQTRYKEAILIGIVSTMCVHWSGRYSFWEGGCNISKEDLKLNRKKIYTGAISKSKPNFYKFDKQIKFLCKFSRILVYIGPISSFKATVLVYG